jgi:hypothetical protein
LAASQIAYRCRVREGGFPDTNVRPSLPLRWPVTVRELQRVPASSALVGELVDPVGLSARAAEIAARQRSPETRRTYAAVYRGFGACLGPDASAES